MTSKLLLISDRAPVLESLRSSLNAERLHLLSALDADTARLLAPGCVLGVLDLGTPGSWRLLQQALPLVALSHGPEDLARALDEGAEDALPQAYDPVELRARVRAALRRPGRAAGQLQVDVVGRRVLARGRSVPVTALEFEVARVLEASPGRTFSREDLLELVWGEGYAGGTRRVDLVVSKLRRKLQSAGLEGAIRAVWGVGYRYEA